MIRSGYWAIVFAESEVRRKGGTALRGSRNLGCSVPECSEQSSVDPGCRWNLGVGGCALEKPMGGSKEFGIQASNCLRNFLKLFNGIVATDVEHIVGKK
jgi:hypothetical protein